MRNTTLNAQTFALVALLTACGDNSTSPVPPGLPPVDAPRNLIEPKDAQSAEAANGAGTSVTGPAAPVVASAATLDLAALKGTTWESKCYRYSNKGDYSKKFWSFGDGTMNSLLLKYKDEACTQISAPEKTYNVWVLSSITLEGLSGDWTVIKGKVTCAAGECAPSQDVALRVLNEALHEGSHDKKTSKYNIADDRLLPYTKSTANLDKLTADANTAAPGITSGSTRPSAPTAPSTPVVAISTADATGLGELATLAGKTYSVCVNGAPSANGSVKSDLKTITFAKGSDFGNDLYTTGNTKFPSANCAGEGKVSSPWSFSNLVVKPHETAGWILLDARACSGDGCKPQKVVVQLTANGFNHASEITSAPGTFFTNSPRQYTLVTP